MKTILVICCIFAVSDALSLLVPIKEYPTQLVYDDKLEPDELVDIVKDDPELLLSKRIGRQYFDGRVPLRIEGVSNQCKFISHFYLSHL